MSKEPKKIDTHLVNNLLTNINLSAELLLKEIPGPLNAPQKKYLETIILEAKKVASLVNPR